MTILALDFGLTRTGVAISDEKESFAIPMETVLTDELLDFLERCRFQESFRRIVLGYPISLRGHTNQMTARIDSFCEILKGRGFDVCLFDERLSTKRAKVTLKGAGFNEKRQKRMKDEMAAVILLQDYLESLGSE